MSGATKCLEPESVKQERELRAVRGVPSKRSRTKET